MSKMLQISLNIFSDYEEVFLIKSFHAPIAKFPDNRFLSVHESTFVYNMKTMYQKSKGIMYLGTVKAPVFGTLNSAISNFQT